MGVYNMISVSMENVHKLFLKEKDEMALNELYNITQDEICNVLKSWKLKLSNEFKDDYNSILGNCYCDMITYLYDKYKIDRR